MRKAKSFPTITLTKCISCIFGVMKSLTRIRVVHIEVFSFEVYCVFHGINKPMSQSGSMVDREKTKKGLECLREMLWLYGGCGEQCKLNSESVIHNLQVS